MWGTRHRPSLVRCFSRFIPTHVGNTSCFARRLLTPTVHPHACGEHPHKRKHSSKKLGSSPRMWGTRFCISRNDVFNRFIPTHVGNTGRPCYAGLDLSVHPHACGEHSYAPRFSRHRTGSSPRMWGTLLDPFMGSGTTRFIPTHVGNTSNVLPFRIYYPVHPHACGEHQLPAGPVMGRAGSSPRMWGTQGSDQRALQMDRFIPTHVGNTHNLVRQKGICTVHPHACGEHFSKVL